MTKRISLTLTDREFALLGEIARDLGQKPAAMARDIFRLGVKHLRLDNHKVWDKFMREALQRRLAEGGEVVARLLEAFLSAPQEQADGPRALPPGDDK